MSYGKTKPVSLKLLYILLWMLTVLFISQYTVRSIVYFDRTVWWVSAIKSHLCCYVPHTHYWCGEHKLHKLCVSNYRSVRSRLQGAAPSTSQLGAAVGVAVIVLVVGVAAMRLVVTVAAQEHHQLALSELPLGIMGNWCWLPTSVLMTSLPSLRRWKVIGHQ